jgi:hypothetical protein
VGAAANYGAKNIVQDPFPVLANGSRWVMPFGNSLGAGILAGQAATNTPRDYAPSLQQRYSVSVHQGKLQWAQEAEGLKVQMPPAKPCDFAITLKITGA